MANEVQQQQPQESGVIVPNPPFLHGLDLLPVRAGMRPVCSWPLDNSEGRAKLHQILQGDSLPLWDLCEREPYPFLMTDLAATFGQWEPEDRPGEIVEGTLFFLVGPDRVYHSGSEQVYKSLCVLSLLEGLPPWRPALDMLATRLPTRKRRVRLAVTYIGRSAD